MRGRGLRLEGVSRSWGAFSIQDVDFDVGAGEYCVLLGPTGAGKTLLLELILGFHKLDTGRIILNGKDITSMPSNRRGLGYVPQDQSLFQHMTVSQNMEFGLKIRGVKAARRLALVNEMLDRLGLEPFGGHYPSTLSGGERQKVALGRALITRPGVILLDEPLSNIDVETRSGLQEELKRLHGEFDLTMIHVTHDQMEAYSLAEKIAIIRGGKIVQFGDAKEIYENPRDEYVAKFLGFENVFDARYLGRVEGISRLGLDGLVMEIDAEIEGSKVKIGLRNEDIALSREPPERLGGWNVFKGVIMEHAVVGPFVYVTVDIGLPVRVTLSKNSFIEIGLRFGERVCVSFKSSSVKILK